MNTILILLTLVLTSIFWLYIFRAAWVTKAETEETALKSKLAAVETNLLARFTALETKLFPVKAAAPAAAPAAQPPSSATPSGS